MGMAELKSELDAILAAIKSDIQTGLHDLIPDFKKCVSKSAEENVYPLYAPTEYERRMGNGGLSDEGNYEVLENDMGLTLINNTTGNEQQPGEGYDLGPITDLIEGGYGYHWKQSEMYNNPMPRPFMEHALDDFGETKVEPMLDQIAGK